MKKVELGIEKWGKTELKHDTTLEGCATTSVLFNSQKLVIGENSDIKIFKCQSVRMDRNRLDRNSQIVVWCWHYGSSGNGNTVILFLPPSSPLFLFLWGYCVC